MNILLYVTLNWISPKHYVILSLKNHNSSCLCKFNFVCAVCEIVARWAIPHVALSVTQALKNFLINSGTEEVKSLTNEISYVLFYAKP